MRGGRTAQPVRGSVGLSFRADYEKWVPGLPLVVSQPRGWRPQNRTALLQPRS